VVLEAPLRTCLAPPPKRSSVLRLATILRICGVTRSKRSSRTAYEDAADLCGVADVSEMPPPGMSASVTAAACGFGDDADE